jgi:hypothetical protein
LHADHGHQPVPGLPCALSFERQAAAKLGRDTRRESTRAMPISSLTSEQDGEDIAS